MKALCYSSLGRGHFKWCETCRIPQVKDDDILIQVSGASLNHMDYFAAQIPVFRIARHNRPAGFDLSGTVALVGKGVRNFVPGDRVFGFGQGFAEYAKVKPWMIAKAPPEINDMTSLAGYVSCAVTGLQILRSNWLDRAFSDRVKQILVIGASGGVGSSVLQLGRILGPSDVSITAVSSGKNEELCRSLGATSFVDYRKLDGEGLSKLIALGSVDLIIDTVSGNIGTPNYVDQGMSLLNNTGVYVATNSLRPKDYIGKFASFLFGSNPMNNQFNLFMMNPFRASKDLEEISHLISSKKFRVPIDSVVPFTESAIREALAKLEKRHSSGKTLIKVS
jgi:NADPH:quinone reductase-like Zn-dependent oxidoreductase